MSEQVFHIGVKGLIRNDKGQFLVLTRSSYVKSSGPTAHKWDIPGGRMNVREDFIDTLKRELKEEINITPDSTPEFFMPTTTQFKIQTQQGEVALVLLIFTFTISSGTVIKLSHEHTEFEWVGLESAIERLSPKYSKDFPNKMRQTFGE